jgi:uncharacterized Zn-binding protein involved in type VI secretion
MSDASRPTYDGEGWIYKGDLTDHGGVVIEGYEHCTWDGIPVARLGCKVYCPKCGDIHTIIEANGFPVHDVKFAIENDLTSCGARVIAKRANTEALKHALRNHNKSYAYDQIFQIMNEGTNLPAKNRRYRITYSGGVVESTTDENGLTTIIKSESPESVNIEIF